jgi:hypothetical protein
MLLNVHDVMAQDKSGLLIQHVQHVLGQAEREACLVEIVPYVVAGEKLITASLCLAGR